MACIGENKPGRHQVRCVHVTALNQKSSIGRAVAVLPPIGKRIGFKAWPTDERLGTFMLSRGEDPPVKSALCELRPLNPPQDNPSGTTDQAKKVDVDSITQERYTELTAQPMLDIVAWQPRAWRLQLAKTLCSELAFPHHLSCLTSTGSEVLACLPQSELTH